MTDSNFEQDGFLAIASDIRAEDYLSADPEKYDYDDFLDSELKHGALNPAYATIYLLNLMETMLVQDLKPLDMADEDDNDVEYQELQFEHKVIDLGLVDGLIASIQTDSMPPGIFVTQACRDFVGEFLSKRHLIVAHILSIRNFVLTEGGTLDPKALAALPKLLGE